MKLRDLTLGDVLWTACHLRDDEWDQIEKFGGARDIDALVMRAMSYPGEKWAFVDEVTNVDNALVVGGFIPVRAGVFSSWFLVTMQGWSLYGRDVTAMAAERVRYKLASGAHRIETLCLASRTAAQKWYPATGLQFESTLKSFCVDGSDAVMYVAVKGGTDVL